MTAHLDATPAQRMVEMAVTAAGGGWLADPIARLAVALAGGLDVTVGAVRLERADLTVALRVDTIPALRGVSDRLGLGQPEVRRACGHRLWVAGDLLADHAYVGWRE